MPKKESAEVIKQWLPGSNSEEFVISANITGIKPRTSGDITATTSNMSATSTNTVKDSCCSGNQQNKNTNKRS